MKRYFNTKLIFNASLMLALTFGLFSCTEDIDFDLNESEEEILVVEGYITNEAKAHTINLSLSGKFYGSGELPKAEGATVTISDGTTTFNLTENEPGVYQTAPTVAGEFGKTYTLNIDFRGQTYTSSATLRDVPEMTEIWVEQNYFLATEDSLYTVFVNTYEKAGKGDYYMWKLYINGSTPGDTLGGFQFSDDEFVDGQQLDSLVIEGGLEAEVGDSLYLEQRTISEEAYDYYLAANLETVWRGGIFDAPPSNVPSTISNGALGLFDAQGVTSIEMVIQE